MTTTHHIPLSEDAALVTALAGTAMAFSHCAEDEAERWPVSYTHLTLPTTPYV